MKCHNRKRGIFMKKLLGLLGAVVFSVMSLTVSAESSDDFLVETYDMTTG